MQLLWVRRRRQGRAPHFDPTPLLLALLPALLGACSNPPAERPSDARPNLERPSPQDARSEANAQPDGSSDAKGVDAGERYVPSEPVNTSSGPVVGLKGEELYVFRGIPYAAPPVGPLRWEAPLAPPSWQQARLTQDFGPACAQPGIFLVPSISPTSEDCLTLNIWSPSLTPSKPLPVLVWLHGGGFVAGGAREEVYQGGALARRGQQLVVTLNYRLGPFGFITLPNHPESANLGLADQQAALRWVRDNISAFGGDPGNVTLMGESAGAISTCAHLLAPSSGGLFHRAILQSGPCPMAFAERHALEPSGAQLVEALGCDEATDPLACLRAQDTEAVLAAFGSSIGIIWGKGPRWVPSVDGVLIPGQPAALIAASSFNKVPTIIGTNQDEGTLFLLLGGHTTVDEARFRAVVQSLLGVSLAAEVYPLYPISDFPSAFHALAQVIADAGFICPARRMAAAFHAQGAAALMYRFEQVPSFSAFAQLGAYHTAELPFVFGTLPPNATSGEAELSLTIIDLWSAFAQGSPPASGGLAWPSFGSDEAYLRLGLTIEAALGYGSSRCAFWDKQTLAIP